MKCKSANQLVAVHSPWCSSTMGNAEDVTRLVQATRFYAESELYQDVSR